METQLETSCLRCTSESLRCCQVAEVNSVVILSSSDVMYILKGQTGGMGWHTSSHLVALGKCFLADSLTLVQSLLRLIKTKPLGNEDCIKFESRSYYIKYHIK